MTTSPSQSLHLIHLELESLRSENLVSMDQYFSILRQLPTIPQNINSNNSNSADPQKNLGQQNLVQSSYADPSHGVTMYFSSSQGKQQQYSARDFEGLRRGPGLPPSSSNNNNNSQNVTEEVLLKHVEGQTFDGTRRKTKTNDRSAMFEDASRDPENLACVKNPDHLDWAKRLGERFGNIAMMGAGIDEEEGSKKG